MEKKWRERGNGFFYLRFRNTFEKRGRFLFRTTRGSEERGEKEAILN